MAYYREIIQKTLDGEEVKRYNGFPEIDAAGFDRWHVLKVCKGERKTHKGFKWEYGKSTRRNKSIACYTLQGKLIASYASMEEAYENRDMKKARWTKYSMFKEYLKYCVNKRDKSYLGMLWRKFPSDQKIPEKILPYICKSLAGPIKEQAKQTKIAMLQDGKVIKMYRNLAEAKKDFPDLTEDIIEYKRELFGCTFKRVSLSDEYSIEDRKEVVWRRPRPIRRFDIFGNLKAEYRSINAAAKLTGLQTRNIKRALKGQLGVLAGDVWEYVSD